MTAESFGKPKKYIVGIADLPLLGTRSAVDLKRYSNISPVYRSWLHSLGSWFLKVFPAIMKPIIICSSFCGCSLHSLLHLRQNDGLRAKLLVLYHRAKLICSFSQFVSPPGDNGANDRPLEWWKYSQLRCRAQSTFIISMHWGGMISAVLDAFAH